MKYVRTKDGKIWGHNPDDQTNAGRLMCDIYEWLHAQKGYIVKETDNIEELFDGILEFCPNETQPVCEVYRRKEDGKLYRCWSQFGETTEPAIDSVIRGAIWTKKGLIYVAKMNDKGEWELL